MSDNQICDVCGCGITDGSMYFSANNGLFGHRSCVKNKTQIFEEYMKKTYAYPYPENYSYRDVEKAYNVASVEITALKSQLEKAEAVIKKFINPCTLSSVAREYFKEKELAMVISDNMGEISQKILESDSIVENIKLCKELQATKNVVQIAQAFLTALNVGDISSESLIHKKLREVMINYRKELSELENTAKEREGK